MFAFVALQNRHCRRVLCTCCASAGHNKPRQVDMVSVQEASGLGLCIINNNLILILQTAITRSCQAQHAVLFSGTWWTAHLCCLSGQALLKGTHVRLEILRLLGQLLCLARQRLRRPHALTRSSDSGPACQRVLLPQSVGRNSRHMVVGSSADQAGCRALNTPRTSSSASAWRYALSISAILR